MLPAVDFDAVRGALRRAREARKWTRAQLEEASGISEGTIFKIETKWLDPRSGSPYVPGADQVLRLIAALPELTVAEFFSDIERGARGGPALSSKGSTVAGSTKGDPADVPATRDRRHLREIAALKIRITRLEIALRKARDGAREIVRAADVVGQSRTPRARRA